MGTEWAPGLDPARRSDPPPTGMNRKTVFRNLAILALVLLALWGWSVMSNSDREYRGGVDTSVALEQLNKKNTKFISIDDREQQLRIELNSPPIKVNDADADKISTKYPPAQAGDQIFDAVQKTGTKYTTNVNEQSVLWQILIFVLPMILLFGLFFFVMSRMQGGGRGGVMGFGKSKAKQLSKDMPKTTFADVAGADEASRSSTRSRTSSRIRRAIRRWARRSREACSCSARPEPARPCWRARLPVRPVSRSSRSPARTSSRCSSVSAPPVCGTCSSRPRTTVPASSSSTRSTPSAASAAQASVVATTNASRHSTSSSWRWTASVTGPASS